MLIHVALFESGGICAWDTSDEGLRERLADIQPTEAVAQYAMDLSELSAMVEMAARLAPAAK